MSTEYETFVIQELKRLSPEQQREVADFIHKLAGRETSPSTSESHIWDEIAAASASLPDDAWQGVPIDGSEQHDHYLYGSPKREA